MPQLTNLLTQKTAQGRDTNNYLQHRIKKKSNPI